MSPAPHKLVRLEANSPAALASLIADHNVSRVFAVMRVGGVWYGWI